MFSSTIKCVCVSSPVIRQLNTSIAISTLTSGQCRLSPLIQVIQDCSHLYPFTVKLLFKLHACESPMPRLPPAPPPPGPPSPRPSPNFIGR